VFTLSGDLFRLGSPFLAQLLLTRQPSVQSPSER
jgi:hypothetical protein